MDTKIPPLKSSSSSLPLDQYKSHTQKPNHHHHHRPKMCNAEAQKGERELPDQWGSFFRLIESGILSPCLDMLCTTRVQLQWLRPLVAPVSSSAPGRGDCSTGLDPCANYFQSSWDLYHSHTGASGATAPLGSSFSGFSLLLGGQRLLPRT